MDSLIIHSGFRPGRVAELTRSHSGTLTVGRGFDNDLVISDVHIGPQQLEFERENDGWCMRVLDFTNPVLLNNEIVGSEPVAVRSGDKLTIGRTRLSLYDAAHPVEHTRKLVIANWIERYADSLFAPLAFLLIACLFDLGNTYFGGSTSLQWTDYAGEALSVATIIVMWSGLWALVGRGIRHHHQFGLQLMATAASYVFLLVLTLICSYLLYNLHHPSTEEIQIWLVFFIAFAALLRLNLIIATRVMRPLPIAVIASALTVMVWYGMIYFEEDDSFQFTPRYSETLHPPLFNLGSGDSADEYFAAVQEKAQALQR